MSAARLSDGKDSGRFRQTRQHEKTGGANQKLILAAMILAVSMTFIDQTLWRGDRDHADGPQLRLQPRPRLENKANLESTLGAQGLPKAQADQIADSVTQGSGGSEATLAEHAGAHAQTILAAVQHDFALALRTVFYAMAGVMAVAFLVALKWMPSGKAEEIPE